MIFFATDSGHQPVKDFLDALSVKMRNKVLDNLKHLQIHGHHLREPYSKPLGDGIFELRTRFGSDITRVLYFFLCWKSDYIDTWLCEEGTENTTEGS
ncbi:type II toxin-antitoxin system RelE/ParE family toxin [uncultured Selenomonas sp.]|uniref:type II toxin-antitoxin system RelE/ParE family toxin n=1 Tax=uncultured Selenomonas sp. TaxID=159275 RepID=UPI0028DCC6D8|nr:type II toxin-antitoxin system RelE/ParE family toxin [uncultured Selenomonas sp.]